MCNDDKRTILHDGADKIKLPERNKDVIPRPPKKDND